MDSLGLTLTAQGRFPEADRTFRLALNIQEAAMGLQSDPVRQTLQDYAAMLQEANRKSEAASMRTLANAIRSAGVPNR